MKFKGQAGSDGVGPVVPGKELGLYSGGCGKPSPGQVFNGLTELTGLSQDPSAGCMGDKEGRRQGEQR